MDVVNCYKIADAIWKIPLSHRSNQKMLHPYMVESRDVQEEVPAFSGDFAAESTAILRHIHMRLVDRFNGLMLHGAAICYEGKTYLFVAPPGTGKTTHVRLWQKHMGSAVRILNGDKPFLRIEDERIMVYGGPWQGKERLGYNGACPLGGIYLLNRGLENRIERSTTGEVVSRLLRATFLPDELSGQLKLLSLLEAVHNRVPIHVLWCNMQPEAVDTVKNHIRSKEKV